MNKKKTLLLLTCLAAFSAQEMVSATDGVVVSGVSGIVSLSPGCPGPQRQDKDCTKALAKKDIQLFDESGKMVGQATTGDNGQFTILAQPGKYNLRTVSEALYPKCRKLEITIEKNQMTNADILCDSGMR